MEFLSNNWALFLGLGILILITVWAYNRLISLKKLIENAFAQIDVQLQRRYDLIPNLVNTAKAYMEHEKSTLEAVIEARAGADKARSNAAKDPGDSNLMSALAGAEGMLGKAMGNFKALWESYPELKADQTIADLSESIESTENKVAFARQAFNDAVTHYETYRSAFPVVIIASMTGFKEAAMFKSDESARVAPKVQF